ncbi:MAG: Na/Pi cotransporter family protein, partial [Thermoanaerobacteraceae bacterium]|nr:Na/Pi cotransporter family protein [Thermoanaerobacteraceae bacterium]
MDLFDFLKLIGGLALFLFGMNLMGTGLEKSAGNKLQGFLENLTTKKFNGFLVGLGVTSIIQSSSATTVMVVGFVNSGIMTLKQAIHVIMGSNVGTTVTAWILSLMGIKGDNVFIQLLKPSSFTPVLAMVGIIFYMFIKNERKKDIGLVLLGFATLIYGMESMSASVEPLGEMEGFRNLLLLVSNPLLGVLLGAVVTGIIQSSSAAVGILLALSVTGQITLGTAIPIIMGMNIGTCVTALISSIGTNRNARRAALVHLYFNVIGTFVYL